MSNLLVIDTSSSICTTVLVQNELTAVKQIEGTRAHGQFLLSNIDDLVKHSNFQLESLDAFAVVAGPGSFTGIRIGIGVVQGLAAALNKPVILLSSLEWLALSAFNKHGCEAVMAGRIARDSEYYTGFYMRTPEHAQHSLGPEMVGSALSIMLPEEGKNKSIVAVGDAWLNLDAFDPELIATFAVIDAELEGDTGSLCELAECLYRSGDLVSAETAVPNYLKENMNYKTAI